MPWDTGLSNLDAETDFQRARRRQVLVAARPPAARRARRHQPDPAVRRGRRGGRAGPASAGSGSRRSSFARIVGSVDRTADFDRRFRPTSNRLRERWQGINLAQRSGRGMPPIAVYRVGDLHFVRDGHHRVSVALALGHTVIEANVTEVLTQIPAAGISDRGDLVVKGYERLFRQRVPLPDAMRPPHRLPRPVELRGAVRERRGLVVPARTGRGRVPEPRARPPGAGTRRSTGRSSRCCTRPTSSAAAPRPRRTCASHATATG